MKMKTFIAVAAIALITACGSPYRATDTTFIVPDATQRAFAAQYPYGTNVVWSTYDPNVIILNDWELTEWPAMDAGDYAVRFDMDNENYYAWYDSDGNWIGSAYVVKDYNNLPSVVRTMLNNQYPAYTISSVNREFAKGRVAYEILLKKDNNKVVMLVDNNGNIIKAKIKTE